MSHSVASVLGTVTILNGPEPFAARYISFAAKLAAVIWQGDSGWLRVDHTKHH
jgi:hypothetical protein